jgi:hypothetical protein
MVVYFDPQTPEQIRQNRIEYIKALRAEPNQCAGELFSYNSCCALGAGYKLFLGITSMRDVEEYTGNLVKEFTPLINIKEFRWDKEPGISVDDITNMNDAKGKSLTEIADWLERAWSI